MACDYSSELETSKMLFNFLNRGAQQVQGHSRHAWNIGINDGPAAGQTVPHLHIHLIPRYAGDVEDPRGGVRWMVAGKARYW
jgi:diadenosine tetraphosphate (Ap4A) HIT family hydrolase